MPVSINRPDLLQQALAFAGICALTLAAAGSCRAADTATRSNAMAQVMAQEAGPCAHQHVLSQASYRFAYQVRHVPDLPHLRVKSFSNIMQTRYEPPAERYNVTRHYCTAIANMDNGTSYPVAYVVSANQGFAGLGGMSVDFCVDGFDRWRVHDNACRSLR